MTCKKWGALLLLVVSGLAACKLGGHHHGGGGGGGGGGLSCSSGQTTYRGAQAGGDEYLWCITPSTGTFAFTDANTNTTTTGGFTVNATYANLLNLTSGGTSGTAVEMVNQVLLVNPGTLSTGSLSPTTNVMAAVFQQSGYCPPSGTNVQFVAMPKSDWTTSNEAYGTASISGSNLMINVFALDGSAGGTETDAFTCDSTTSLITFTDSKGKQRILATSPSGAFVAKGGQGAIGVAVANSNITLTAGDKYLGMLYEPATATPTKAIGFTVTSASSLAGFDPATGNSNLDSLTLPTQSSPGLFTGGTLFEGGDTDTQSVAVASNIAGRIVLWCITYDSTKNTVVNVLLMQQ